MLKGELNREEYDKENAHEFMCFLKSRLATQACDAKEVREEEFREAVKE